MLILALTKQQRLEQRKFSMG